MKYSPPFGGYDDRWIKHLRLLLIPHPPRLCASPITAARWWLSRRRPASLQSAEDLFRDKRHVTSWWTMSIAKCLKLLVVIFA